MDSVGQWVELDLEALGQWAELDLAALDFEVLDLWVERVFAESGACLYFVCKAPSLCCMSHWLRRG